MNKVYIKHSVVPKLRRFTPWVYANEIDSSLEEFQSGEVVALFSKKDGFLGTAYVNPKCAIFARVLSFGKEEIGKKFFHNRIKRAIAKREALLSQTNAVRLIHSEADFLPGLIVDKYGDTLSIQINTAGMETFRELILSTLKQLVNPSWIVEKSDEHSREIEGLESKNGTLFGTPTKQFELSENGLTFLVDIEDAQKTGFYLDQRKNRAICASYIKEGDTVLDICCNAGGFGIYALAKGAKNAVFVDISESAIEQTKANLAANAIETYETYTADAFTFMKEKKYKNSFDLIVLDPPSFAKTKEQASGAKRGFKHLLMESTKAVKDGGLIALFSCSFHVGKKELLEIAMEVSHDLKVQYILLEQMQQDSDHPCLINASASFYLNGLLLRVEK
ncbi:class I SAM-dependent rRNA methyltransferase [Sulfurospirillum diekertiae]|uniref:Ribosomal RNA large subunit methyltransferase I n=1 Tax=Sulfurospirillum diekertiae TaxID=1854492 RepID=A0A1Y0HRV2_9BACT|nr:class I SAM-dependent rRNA methyltransferase [Sulfurospirillum diekertiae]ARU50034.1 Ribosomal RNA large subunit methyltransferase I [Sulfurospirillum diekertiae]ASC94822.1 Ribosomal RNA large subunit methyltransferase I [Sulfurospirillum diekertiae]